MSVNITNIPNDIKIQIINYLPLNALMRLSQCNKTFNQFSQDEKVKEIMCKRMGLIRDNSQTFSDAVHLYLDVKASEKKQWTSIEINEDCEYPKKAIKKIKVVKDEVYIAQANSIYFIKQLKNPVKVCEFENAIIDFTHHDNQFIVGFENGTLGFYALEDKEYKSFKVTDGLKAFYLIEDQILVIDKNFHLNCLNFDGSLISKKDFLCNQIFFRENQFFFKYQDALFQIAEPEPQKIYEKDKLNLSLGFIANETIFLSKTDGEITQTDLKTLKTTICNKFHTDSISSFHQFGCFVVSASYDKKIQIFTHNASVYSKDFDFYISSIGSLGKKLIVGDSFGFVHILNFDNKLDV